MVGSADVRALTDWLEDRRGRSPRHGWEAEGRTVPAGSVMGYAGRNSSYYLATLGVETAMHGRLRVFNRSAVDALAARRSHPADGLPRP